MSIDLFIAFIAGGIAAGWPCFRWGQLDEAGNIAKRNADLDLLDRKVSPSLSGGPREPA